MAQLETCGGTSSNTKSGLPFLFIQGKMQLELDAVQGKFTEFVADVQGSQQEELKKLEASYQTRISELVSEHENRVKELQSEANEQIQKAVEAVEDTYKGDHEELAAARTRELDDLKSLHASA